MLFTVKISSKGSGEQVLKKDFNQTEAFACGYFTFTKPFRLRWIWWHRVVAGLISIGAPPLPLVGNPYSLNLT
ncbi:MAG: hypothetical protein WCH99_10650 [Verrucomicrobiota bacterium]